MIALCVLLLAIQMQVLWSGQWMLGFAAALLVMAALIATWRQPFPFGVLYQVGSLWHWCPQGLNGHVFVVKVELLHERAPLCSFLRLSDPEYPVCLLAVFHDSIDRPTLSALRRQLRLNSSLSQ